MSQNAILKGILVIIVIFLAFLLWKSGMIRMPVETKTIEKTVEKTISPKINYVALGDSYSNGQGASPKDAWPEVLTKDLNDAGHDVTLVANPSISGWTTQDLINGALPIFVVSEPTFATLMIGANDAFQGTGDKKFKENLVKILDAMQKNIPDKKKIVLITIPDSSVTPLVESYGGGRDLQKKIEQFNKFIKEEGKKRDLRVVDVFGLSKDMGMDQSLVAKDGLHPSAKELKLWEEKIFPVVDSLLKN